MKMRRSRVLERLRQGEIASCTKINTSDPRVVEIAAMSGLDSVWLCLEHTGNTLKDIENQIRAAKMFDVDAIVRVPRGCYSDMIRPLELDASGIMVPHVMSADDARQVVHWTRFAPVGLRPLDGGNADGAYGQMPGDDYLLEANEQRLLIIQIEDPEPLEEIEEIASIEGIDVLFFGPGDFLHSIGHPFQFDHPAVNDALEQVAAAARRHGKYAGTPANSENIEKLTEMGYRFLTMGADVIMLANGFEKVIKSFRHAVTIPRYDA